MKRQRSVRRNTARREEDGARFKATPSSHWKSVAGALGVKLGDISPAPQETENKKKGKKNKPLSVRGQAALAAALCRS